MSSQTMTLRSRFLFMYSFRKMSARNKIAVWYDGRAAVLVDSESQCVTAAYQADGSAASHVQESVLVHPTGGARIDLDEVSLMQGQGVSIVGGSAPVTEVHYSDVTAGIGLGGSANNTALSDCPWDIGLPRCWSPQEKKMYSRYVFAIIFVCEETALVCATNLPVCMHMISGISTSVFVTARGITTCIYIRALPITSCVSICFSRIMCVIQSWTNRIF